MLFPKYPYSDICDLNKHEETEILARIGILQGHQTANMELRKQLDEIRLASVLNKLREFSAAERPVDLLVANYVYEHVADGTQKVMRYTNVFPEERVFTWAEIGRFRPSQYLLMHSVIYRTEMLRACRLELPSTPSMWTTSLSTSPCPLSRACIIWIWTLSLIHI